MTTRIALLVLAVVATTSAAQQGAHWSDGTRRVVLDNGLTVLMLPRGDLPIVSVQALYRFGSRNERPGGTGAAHFVEHMAFRSTEDIAKQDLTNQILRWGGRWNGYTSYDQTTYGSHTPSSYLEWLIYLERQRMRHVRFDSAEVERERTSVIAEERQYRNSPVYTLVEHQLRRAALVAHPYGSPIMGRLSDLEGVTTAELERLYRELYAPNNLILAIVGRFDPAEALALVRKHFDGVPGDGEPAAIRTVEPSQQGQRRVVVRARAGRAHLEMVVHSPSASSHDFPVLLALDGVLAGGKAPGRRGVRPGSRLHRALVEPGLATAVTTEVELSEYPGLYSIGVAAPADADLAAIETTLDAALQDAMRTITDEDVARAARQAGADYAFAAGSNRAVANLLAVYEQMGSYSLLASIPRRHAALRAAEVRAFARAWLHPDRRSFGVLIPDTAPEPVERPSPAAGTSDAAAAADAPLPQRATTRPIPAPGLVIPDVPAPSVRRLDNGLTVLAVQVPGESAHVRMRIEAGSRLDPADRAGTALLTARIVTGAEGSPLVALERDREVRLSLGAFDLEDPFMMRQAVVVAAAALPGDLAAAVEAMVAAAEKPAFDAAQLDRARESLARELEAYQDDSRWRADRAAFDRLYQSSGGRPVEGDAASRARITAADLSSFHRLYYQPERTVVAIAGPVDPAETIERVAGVLGGWRGRRPSGPARLQTDRVEIVPAPPFQASAASAPARGERIVHVPLDKDQASIAVGLPGVAHGSGDFAALAALNYLLGETGYAGRLGERLVDTGLAYAVYSSTFSDRMAGPILITTDAVRARDAVDRIVATLDEFATDGVTAAEVREAQGFLLGRLLFRYESAAAATGALVELGAFGERASPRDFAQRVLSLTPAEVGAVARRYYDPSRAAIVVAGRW